MTAPFLDLTAFTAEYQGSLSTGEQTTATRLLQVISDGIRGLKPDVDTTAATQVVFEVVRDAMKYGDLGPLSDFINRTGHREESGTFDEATRLVDDYLTKRQRRLLGVALATSAGPRGNFVRDDFGPCL